MARVIVGLFTSASEAEFAATQAQAAGLAPGSIRIATQQTLQAQNLPDAGAPAEPFRESVTRFFTDLFSGNQLDDAQAHIAATGPEHAVVTIETNTPGEAEQARAVLDRCGAVDVYKQRPLVPTAPEGEIDLEGDLSRVRDDEELDANGLTTH
ncbi:hypothetical protein [Hymenobacter negativus]|uniref:Uncharacterized protein n=1 Tax=Hymenobacter negativus TaxID=2795026 RepID=A0ABS0Q1W9_9BACT|nr:hypothetical protein [Hymenobacter negativus]MBH8556627.1 hypothetical protein [Hymenobacter negativus]